MTPLEYLKKIEKNGYEAYIVGGYVRDLLLGLKTTDVDITTSATPKEICEIFNIKKFDYLGSVNIKGPDINVDITTYRKERNYYLHRPRNVVYIKDLKTDLKRRDFTINTICMNSDGKIIDYLGGIDDIHNHIIKVVGNTNKKLKEDPLRMLRAIRLSIMYDFRLSDDILVFILNNKYLFKEISYERRKKELGKILINKNCIKGLEMLRKLNLLEILEIDYDKVCYVGDYLGMWSQLTISSKYPFTKVEKTRMNNLKEIVISNCIDYKTIFKYGKYDSLIAARILGYSKDYVDNLYDKMKIHSKDELNITGLDIKNILKLQSSPIIKVIKDDLIKEILSGNLSNEREELGKYILKKWK